MGSLAAPVVVILMAGYWFALGSDNSATIVSGNNQGVHRTGLEIPGGKARFDLLLVNLRSIWGAPRRGRAGGVS